MVEDSQDAVFAQAREAFARRGLLRHSLRLCLGERLYSVRCDDDCFSIYRVNEKPFLPPGLPGWMVCRLSAGECFSLDQDEKACALPQTPEQLAQARAWLELVLKSLPAQEP
ncbi:MAG: hypothetical protein HY794_02780 [Desulfarculus sp.]|nr:hypothetical protein [Desulfarculus sp.]